MSYIKKDINFGLLLIVIVLATVFAGLGIYFHQDYTSLQEEYSTRLNSLEQVTDQLLFYKSRLNRTTEDLAVQQEDESELEKKYVDLREENENLDGSVSQLEAELSSTKQSLVEATNELRDLQIETLNQKTTIAQLRNENEELEGLYKGFKSKFNSVCDGNTGICGD